MLPVGTYPYNLSLSSVSPVGSAVSVSGDVSRHSEEQPVRSPQQSIGDTFELSTFQTPFQSPNLYAPASSASAPSLSTERQSASGAPAKDATENEEDSDASRSMASTDKKADGSALTEEEQQRVDELKARDREVRQHEQAHMSAGGSYAGAASFTIEKGPDGQSYAVGGEVSIDTSKEKDPEATIAKMRTVRAAATAPANPSSQDQAVAAMAAQQELEAQQELRQQREEETNSESIDPAAANATAEPVDATPDSRERSTGTGVAASPRSGEIDPVRAAYEGSSPLARSRGIDLVA